MDIVAFEIEIQEIEQRPLGKCIKYQWLHQLELIWFNNSGFRHDNEKENPETVK